MKFEILDQNGGVARVEELDVSSSIKIGKTASCELCLDDPSVSRTHAVIEKTDAGYRLSDRMTPGGTYVNQQKVDPNSPVILANGSVLKFGQISVRVLFDSAAPAASIEEDDDTASTVAMEAPNMSDLENAANAAGIMGASSVLDSGSANSASAPASSVLDTPAQPSTPAASPVSSTASSSFGKAAASTGFGAGSAFNKGGVGPTIIRKKKKRPVSFERRFLSARGSGNCSLEIAMLWRGNVISVKQYTPSDKTITAGVSPDCNYLVDTLNNGEKVAIAYHTGNNWQIIFNNAYEGFILKGDRKIEFKTGDSVEFTTPAIQTYLRPGSLACDVDGNVRAKFVFGEVSILIRFVEAVPFAAPLLGGFKASNYGPLFASLLIHFALFSVILFSTDRVDALMVDRIMSTSRFAVVVEQPVEEPPEEEEIDEEEPPEEEPEESDNVGEVQDTPFAANTASDNSGPSNGKVMSKAEASAAAQATGLLAQSNAMNSMLAAGLNTADMDNLDWSSFDSSAAAASSNYGLGTTGAGGGGAGLGGFGGGGFGPGGGGGRGGAIAVAGRNKDLGLGKKGEARPEVKMKNPEVSGSIDKRIIQKIVRQHFGELRACYEREVAKIKGLSGKVTVVWIIAGNGSVTKALVKETTMKNKNVETCITNSIMHWRFPAPKGGGMAQVEYPFDFILSGGGD